MLLALSAQKPKQPQRKDGMVPFPLISCMYSMRKIIRLQSKKPTQILVRCSWFATIAQNLVLSPEDSSRLTTFAGIVMLVDLLYHTFEFRYNILLCLSCWRSKRFKKLSERNWLNAYSKRLVRVVSKEGLTVISSSWIWPERSLQKIMLESSRQSILIQHSATSWMMFK